MVRVALSRPLAEVARRLRRFLSGLAVAAVTLGAGSTAIGMAAPPPVAFALRPITITAVPSVSGAPPASAAQTVAAQTTVRAETNSAATAARAADPLPEIAPYSTVRRTAEPRTAPGNRFVSARGQRAPPSR